MALRTRIVVAAADGLKNKEIVAKYQVTADTVRLWCNRWVNRQDRSLDDLSIDDRLQDAPRPGAPARITADQRCHIEALACEAQEDSRRSIKEWTTRELTDEVKKRKIVEQI
jgi:putative transposase